jgi:hypothetical protein
MAFKLQMIGEIAVWSGDPDCDAARSALEQHLNKHGASRLGPNQPLTEVQKGNLGEALAFVVGLAGPHSATDFHVLAQNCRNPIVGNSKTGLDILWVYLDGNNEQSDHLWVQEVKTTSDLASASYLKTLKQDYAKLFGPPSGLTLEERLGDLAFQFEYGHKQPALARRIRRLGGRRAQEIHNVTLSPTGVHDKAVSAIADIEDVRISLVTQYGWTEERVKPWLIEVAELERRLKEAATQ